MHERSAGRARKAAVSAAGGAADLLDATLARAGIDPPRTICVAFPSDCPPATRALVALLRGLRP